MFVLRLSLKKAYWQAWNGGTGHVIPPCLGEHAGETVPRARTEAYATLPCQSGLSAVFFLQRQGSKRYSTMTFLFISTFSLLFSLKCHLLIYQSAKKYNDHVLWWKKRLGS